MKLIDRKIKWLVALASLAAPAMVLAALPSCAHQEISYIGPGQTAPSKLATNKECKLFLNMKGSPAGNYNVTGTFVNTSNVSSVPTGTITPTVQVNAVQLNNGRVLLNVMLTCNAAKQWVIADPNTPLYDCNTPVAVAPPSNANVGVNGGSCWKSAEAYYNHVVAIKKDGTLWTWGAGDWGQLGNGNTPTQNIPKQVGADANWLQATAGSDYTLAVKSDGTLWGWGMNGNRGLGDGTRVNKSTPTQIGTDTNWKMVSANREHTTAVKTDGTLWSWGIGSARNLPADTSPVQVGTDTNWVLSSAGMSMGTALNNNGAIMSWGQNRYGALGIGQTGSAGERDGSSGLDKSETPLLVGKNTDKWKAVQSSGFTSYAIKSDGSLWAWGLVPMKSTIANSPKQMGKSKDWKSTSNADAAIKNNGTLWIWGTVADMNNKASPMKQFGTDSDWQAVSFGASNSVGIKNDGSLWAWGKGAYGQLGNGTSGANASSSTPVGVSCQ